MNTNNCYFVDNENLKLKNAVELKITANTMKNQNSIHKNEIK